MSGYSRFGLFYLPSHGALAAFGAAWLGWDVDIGSFCRQPDVTAIHDITATPRKYGFHGTLKAPFRLSDGQTLPALQKAVAALASDLPPVTLEGLALTDLAGFLALVPRGDTAALGALAGRVVTQLDRFRAPAGDAELARRRGAGLSPVQEAHLLDWGYPYVLGEFRFHMTLTGQLTQAQMPGARAALERLLPPLPAPFVLDQIALVGERADGFFETIHRYALTR